MVTTLKDVEHNRRQYIAALRYGGFKKGTTKSDEKTGDPIFESEEDKDGSCACAIMHDMFFESSHTDFLRALDLSTAQCRYIQKELNDSDLTLPEIADIIEDTIFND